MRRGWCIWVALIVGVTCQMAAQRGDGGATSGEKYVGVWSGTWAGAGTGGFELTLEKNIDGTVGGRVSVTGDPTYKATFRTLTFDGPKMTATYDFPPDERVEVVLGATFEGDSATGTWSAREKANGNEAVSGTWTVKKK
jgi:hypothetical protein